MPYRPVWSRMSDFCWWPQIFVPSMASLTDTSHLILWQSKVWAESPLMPPYIYSEPLPFTSNLQLIVYSFYVTVCKVLYWCANIGYICSSTLIFIMCKIISIRRLGQQECSPALCVTQISTRNYFFSIIILRRSNIILPLISLVHIGVGA